MGPPGRPVAWPLQRRICCDSPAALTRCSLERFAQPTNRSEIGPCRNALPFGLGGIWARDEARPQ